MWNWVWRCGYCDVVTEYVGVDDRGMDGCLDRRWLTNGMYGGACEHNCVDVGPQSMYDTG